MEKEFNLLEENWIKVMTNDLQDKEVSLMELLINAQNYRILDGEMPTQDFAILRLVLAVATTIFYRYDNFGNEEIIDEDWDAEDVLERWKSYMDQGQLPEKAIRSYFSKYHDRFYLIHPTAPFYQVANLEYGTDYDGIGCLLGTRADSNNPSTRTPFGEFSPDELSSVSYNEAARWLVYLMQYSPATKDQKKDKNHKKAQAGTGWLGQLGGIYVTGRNIFEAIMLNLVPLTGTYEPWESPKPEWEMPPKREQTAPIAPPANLPELYTLQGRRIELKTKNGRVTGFRIMNGDYFSAVNYFDEPMTIWRKYEEKEGKKKTGNIVYRPQKHDGSVLVWREFSTIFDTRKSEHIPGIIRWLNYLKTNNLLVDGEELCVQTVSLIYEKTFAAKNQECVHDALGLSADILGKLENGWITVISDEVEKCEKVHITFRSFAADILKVRGIDTTGEHGQQLAESIRNTLSEAFYYRIDMEFRTWLTSINKESIVDIKVKEWRETAFNAAVEAAKEYCDMNGIMLKWRVNDKETGSIISVIGALEWFERKMKWIFGDEIKTE